MPSFTFHSYPVPRLVLIASVFLALAAYAPFLQAQAAYVRVSQVGYEAGNGPFRAYLMSTAEETGATFAVLNSKGATVDSGRIGAGSLLGSWSHSKTVTYNVYALDFNVPASNLYTIKVSGPAPATSPAFAVDSTAALYPGLLLNTLFFYETERDGAHFIPNALRTAPGHLKDANAQVYATPPLDANDFHRQRAAGAAARVGECARYRCRRRLVGRRRL